MRIDNSWVVTKMKEQKKKEWLTLKLKECGLSWYRSEWDSSDTYSIVPRGFTYYIDWFWGRYCITLDTRYQLLYLYNIKYKDAAIKLIGFLEEKQDIEYTLHNRSSEVIEQ
jgi:hypothetical protein